MSHTDPGHEDPYDHLRDPESMERLEEIARRSRQDGDHFARQVEAVTQSLTEAVRTVEFQFERAALDRIVTDPIADQYIEIGVETPDATFDRTAQQAKDLLAALSATDKVLLRAEFMAEMFGVVSDGNAQCYDQLLTLLIASSKGRLDVQSKELAADVARLLESWRSRKDGAIWGDLYMRHQRSGPLLDAAALAKELGFIALVGELARSDGVTFTWESRAQIVEYVKLALEGREPGFPIDAGKIYEMIDLLQRKFDLPFVAAAELAQYAFAAAGTQHEVLLVLDAPLRADYIARLDRVRDKLVFVMTGLAGERLVLKCEMPGNTETVADFKRRFELNLDLANHCMDRVPAIVVLEPGELDQLLGMSEGIAGARELLKLLHAEGNKPGLKDCSLILKMEFVNVGESLAAMIRKGTVPKDLLSRTTLRDLGRMAMFDLLMGNEDRFQNGASASDHDKFCNFENVDFRMNDEGRLEIVPLDNISPVDCVSQGKDDFIKREFLVIATPERRMQYARDLIIWMCERLKLPLPPGDSMAVTFMEGMTDALEKMRTYIRLAARTRNAARWQFLQQLLLRLEIVK